MTLLAAIHCASRLGRTVSSPTVNSPFAVKAVHPSQSVWIATFAYWPVWPIDEQYLFWLEPVWRRRHALTRRWEYRAFRSDAEKTRETADLADLPPFTH